MKYQSKFIVENGFDRVSIRVAVSEVVFYSELSVIPSRVSLRIDLEELSAYLKSFLGITEILFHKKNK